MLDKSQQTPLSLGILIGLAVTLAVYFGVVRPAPATQAAPTQQDGFAVSGTACMAIARAIETYESRHQRRPGRLADLVDAQLLRASALHDERRLADSPPTYKKRPMNDVVYFPSLRRFDAPDLILLCTLVLREGETHYHAVTNDGGYRTLSRAELITALNRTYTAIGKDIPWQKME
ncbi:MAG: hypothetical protein FWE88_01485 [Phycisphaerae bacterium]|nr:hypothetical protein [Phycisphaerae bacterium]